MHLEAVLLLGPCAALSKVEAFWGVEVIAAEG